MPNFRPFSACWGDISFTQAPHTTTRCYAGAIFLSCNPPGAPRRGGHRRNRAHLETQSLAAVPVGGGGAWPDNESTRRATHQRPGATGVEGAGGTGGPGRGAGGWRQGQGGPRDRPLRAAGSRVAISRAGRRPPAHTAARPQSSTTERPEHQRCHTATTCSANGERAGRRPRAHQAARPDESGPTAPGTPAAPQAPLGPGQSALTLRRRRAPGVPCS